MSTSTPSIPSQRIMALQTRLKNRLQIKPTAAEAALTGERYGMVLTLTGAGDFLTVKIIEGSGAGLTSLSLRRHGSLLQSAEDYQRFEDDVVRTVQAYTQYP